MSAQGASPRQDHVRHHERGHSRSSTAPSMRPFPPSGRLRPDPPMWINGHAVKTVDLFPNTSPFDTRIVLGHFARAASCTCATRSMPRGRRSRHGAGRRGRERVTLLRRVADLIRQHRWALRR